MHPDNPTLLDRFEAEYHDRLGTTAERRHRARAELTKLGAALGARSLVQTTASDLMAWQGAQIRGGAKPSTVRNREGMIRPFFGWATTAGLIPWQASAQLQSVPAVPSARNLPRPYKTHELREFREALATRYPLAPLHGPGSRTLAAYWRTRSQRSFSRVVGKHLRHVQLEAQVALALELGLRRSEIYNLTLAQVEPDNPAVIVKSGKQRHGSERWREVPYTAHARLCVRDWLDLRELMAPPHARPWLTLVLGNQTGAMKQRQFQESLLPVKPRGQWEWHRFRHTFATERLRSGMPLEKLQVMLGHSRIDTTLLYAQILSSDVASDAARTEEAFARRLGLGA